jgi:pimeloyl-ACP methyl ester carboxylesterase/hemoglobin-like flavoprotein
VTTRSGGSDGFPPSQFDDYEVVRPLGTGGMGTVFLGHDRMLDRPVALKFIANDNPDPRAREHFLAEARAIARLHHPNVVGIYRIGTIEGRPYLAYEMIEGEGLHRVPRPMAWRRALEIGLGVARGLAAVHDSGVLHRDIKPANIVVGTHPKLIDFGLARRRDERVPVVAPAPALLEARSAPAGGDSTSLNAVEGTPLYMAPELWRGAAASPASDVYALGLVIWELLGGDLPHAGLHGVALVNAILAEGVPSIATRRQDVPAPFAELIARCVDRDPGRRPTCAGLRDELEALRALYAPLVGTSLGGDEAIEAAEADALSASLGRAAAMPERLASRFYELVFAADPALRPLFAADMRGQRVKLESTLQTVVRNVRSPEMLVPLLEDLGERHAAFGVLPAHFEAVGQALLAALAEAEGPAWTPALEASWLRAYQYIAGHMSRGVARASASGSSLRYTPPAPRIREAPAPRYARSGDAVIAYQVFGDGPRDLVVIPGWVSNVELAWQEPSCAEFLSRLARRARVIVFDRRGTGLSDRTSAGLGLDGCLADLLAVLDAAGSERPSVLGIGDAAGVAAMLAATHPERMRGLVLYGGTPCLVARPDFPAGIPAATIEAMCARIQDHWGEALLVEELAPSRAASNEFRAWWARLLRASATPTGVVALLRGVAALDLRAVLPAVRVPTLVVHRRGDRMVPFAGGQALANRIVNARLAVLDGDDHLPFVGDRDKLVATIEDFVVDTPTVHDAPARLMTLVAARPRPACAPAWRHVVERHGGSVGEPIEATAPPVLLATFTVPAAALRAVRALAHDLTSAAIQTVIVSARAAGDDAAVTLTAELAATAGDGELVLTAAARDLASTDLGELVPRAHARGELVIARLAEATPAGTSP